MNRLTLTLISAASALLMGNAAQAQPAAIEQPVTQRPQGIPPSSMAPTRSPVTPGADVSANRLGASPQDLQSPTSFMRSVMVDAPGTPGQRGYLEVARQEAVIALNYLDMALQRPNDLAWMRRYGVGAVNAIDPTMARSGPGLGYGAGFAARKVVDVTTAAAHAFPRDENIVLRSAPVAASAQNAVTRLSAAYGALRTGLQAPDAPTAARNLALAREAVARALDGADLDNNGEIVWSQGEGGLNTAWEQMAQMLIGAGVPYMPNSEPFASVPPPQPGIGQQAPQVGVVTVVPVVPVPPQSAQIPQPAPQRPQGGDILMIPIPNPEQ